MSKVTSDDIRFASDWLRSYDEESEDAERAYRVAAMLDDIAHERERDKFVRLAMRETGCSRDMARAYYQRKERP